MSAQSVIEPSRHVFNPMLADEPVIEMEGATANAFYTPAAQRIERRLDMIVAVSAGVCLSIAWTINLANGPKPLSHLFVLLTFAIAGTPALVEAWHMIRSFKIDIDVLMLLGAGLAAYIGNPFEGALLLFLFALSGALESLALRRTQSAIVALRELAPTEASLIEGQTTSRVALRQIPVGATVLVRPGEKVPLDGEITSGASSVDESAINGESIPRDCTVGDTVFAGTHNLNGRMEIRVSKLAADTTLAKIINLVTEARHNPATAQRLIDRIGPAYSVIVIVGAVLVGLGAWLLFGIASNEAVRRGIAVLIVASPCALIIATPVVYLSAIASAARRGVLIKGGAHFEVLARAAAVAFDKTGTLTTGDIRLTDVDTDGAMDETELLEVAGALEGSSTHPLAAAVNRAVQSRGLNPPAVTDYDNKPGEGVSGVINGQRVWIGRPDRLPHDVSVDYDRDVAHRVERLRSEGKTVSAVAVGDHVGLMAFQDTKRDASLASVDTLRRQGIRHIEMLTGDHESVARQVAAELGLDGYRAALAPDDKVAATRELKQQTGTLVLVGDGINDAPALAHADVGIAMGSMGADVALDAADVVIMKDRIERVAWLHRHALRTAGIVKQNLTIAIGVIAILSVFAVLGEIPLPLAVIGHEGSTVIVALNALRLLRTDAA